MSNLRSVMAMGALVVLATAWTLAFIQYAKDHAPAYWQAEARPIYGSPMLLSDMDGDSSNLTITDNAFVGESSHAIDVRPPDITSTDNVGPDGSVVGSQRRRGR